METRVFLLFVAGGAIYFSPPTWAAKSCSNVFTRQQYLPLVKSAPESRLADQVLEFTKFSQKSSSRIELSKTPGFWNLVDQLSAFAPPYDVPSSIDGGNYRMKEIARVFGYAFAGSKKYSFYDGSSRYFTAEFLLSMQESGLLSVGLPKYSEKLLEIFRPEHAERNSASTRVDQQFRLKGLNDETKAELAKRIEAMDARHEPVADKGQFGRNYEKYVGIRKQRQADERQDRVNTVYGPLFASSLPHYMFELRPKNYLVELIRHLDQAGLIDPASLKAEDRFYRLFE